LHNIRKSKWKVEWIDPSPGLIDYVVVPVAVVLLGAGLVGWPRFYVMDGLG
jgi:hypothetical protein